MAAGRFLWVAVAAFLASGCVAQETQAAAGLSQERVRELFSLAAEAGLDVSGVASEDELLRMIASHPPAMQALRVSPRHARAARIHARRLLTRLFTQPCAMQPAQARIARENAEADEGGGEAPGEDDGIQIVDLDEEEDDDAARGQAYTQSLFGHSAFRQPEDRAATDEGDAGGARGYAHGGQAQEEGHEAAADEGSAGAPGDAHKPASDEEWEEDADADDADAGPSEHVPEVRAQSTGTKASGEQRPAGGDETELRVLESATTKLFTVADSDDDLQLTPRGLLDGIAAYGQLLLTTHGCALPPGTALTMRQLSDGVRALFEACDTVRAAAPRRRRPARPLRRSPLAGRAARLGAAIPSARAC